GGASHADQRAARDGGDPGDDDGGAGRRRALGGLDGADCHAEQAVTGAAFRKLALSLPEASEAPHCARASFRVRKQLCATITTAGDEAMVRVAPRAKLYGLLKAQPDVFFSYGGWTERNGSLGIHLAKLDATLARELVIDSWRHVAPKRALSMLTSL